MKNMRRVAICAAALVLALSGVATKVKFTGLTQNSQVEPEV
jgi:hypothetical protein